MAGVRIFLKSPFGVENWWTFGNWDVVFVEDLCCRHLFTYYM